ADILIFDEPTAVLTPQEIDELIDIMKRLVQEGKTIIFITHKLKEIMRACDTVTVIRRGKMIDSLPVSDTDENRLASLMVGRDVSFTVEQAPSQGGEAVRAVEGLVGRDKRRMDAGRGLQ